MEETQVLMNNPYDKDGGKKEAAQDAADKPFSNPEGEKADHQDDKPTDKLAVILLQVYGSIKDDE